MNIKGAAQRKSLRTQALIRLNSKFDIVRNDDSTMGSDKYKNEKNNDLKQPLLDV